MNVGVLNAAHPSSTSYTNNIPRLDNIEIAKFADDTALLATGWDPHIPLENYKLLQNGQSM